MARAIRSALLPDMDYTAGIDHVAARKSRSGPGLAAETGLDCWLTLARETDLHPDPGIEQVVGAGVVRNSAFLFGVGGERIAIVANFDTSAIRAKGVFREVIGYDEDIRGPLLAALRRLDPRQIGLNYSLDDVTADGLTHGHWLLLQQLLGGTPYLDRLTSAAPLLARLRGRKSPAEVERIRRAVAVTEQIVGLLTPQIRPGLSERELAGFRSRAIRRPGRGAGLAGRGVPDRQQRPRRPSSATRTRRATIRVEPGHLVHIDLGVRRDGYCSDLQRMWYVRRRANRRRRRRAARLRHGRAAARLRSRPRPARGRRAIPARPIPRAGPYRSSAVRAGGPR